VAPETVTTVTVPAPPPPAETEPETATTEESAPETEPETATTEEPSAPERLTRQQAISAARKRYPGESVREVERDDEDGQAVWKVKLRTRGGAERKVSVAVADGQIVKTETDRDDNDRDGDD
jgi:uncharacterized membrane protein YkoI